MGTAGVEVAQVGTVPLLERLVGFLQVLALRADEVFNDVLDERLGAAVRVRRTDRAVFGNGNHVLEPSRIAVHGGRGREDNVGDIMLLHRAQERDGTADIYAVVFERDLGGFTNSLVRG